MILDILLGSVLFLLVGMETRILVDVYTTGRYKFRRGRDRVRSEKLTDAELVPGSSRVRS